MEGSDTYSVLLREELWAQSADVPLASLRASSMEVMRHAIRHGRQPVPDVLGGLSSSAGAALPEPVRRRFEAAFGHGFAHVRVHTSGTAQRAADQLQAHAFALGADVYFGPGEYAPGTPAGDRLLAHELTHVVQHDEGRLPSGGGVSKPSDPAEVEAYRNEATILRDLDQQVDALQPDGVDWELDMPSEEAHASDGQTGPQAEETPTQQPASESSRGAVLRDGGGGGGGGCMSDEDLIGPVLQEEPEVEDAEEAETEERDEAHADDVAPDDAQDGDAAQVEGGEQGDPTGASEGSGGGASPLVAGTRVSPDVPEHGVLPAAPVSEAQPEMEAAPGLAEIAAQIESSGLGYGSEVRDYGAAALDTLNGGADTLVEQLESAGEAGLASLRASFAAQQERVSAQTQQAVASIAAACTDQIARVAAAAESLRAEVRAAVDGRKAAATARVEQARANLIALGDSEAQRAIDGSAALAEEAAALGEVSGAGEDPQRDAQERASADAANKAAEMCAEAGEEIAQRCRDSSAEAASGVGQHLETYHGALDQAATESDALITNGAQQATETIRAAADEATATAQSLGDQAVAGLAQREQEASATLQETVSAGVQHANSSRMEIEQSVDEQIQQVNTRFEAQTQQAVDAIQADPMLDEETAEEAETAALAELASGRDEALGAIDQMRGDALSGLGEVGAMWTQAIVDAVTAGQADAEAYAAGVCDHLEAHIQDSLGLFEAHGTAVVDGMTQSVQGVLAELDAAQAEFDGQVATAETETATGLAQLVDDGLAREREQLTEIHGELASAHSELASEFSSVKAEAERKGASERTIERSIWSALGDFFSDLASSVIEWCQQTFGKIAGTIIGYLVAFIVRVVQVVVMGLYWVFAQIVNLLWGFVWGEKVFDVPGDFIFVLIGDIIAGIVVWGDLRDIWKHLIWKLITGEEITWVDWMIVGMSALGLVLTVTGVGAIIMAIVKGGGKATVKAIIKALIKELGPTLANKLIKELGPEAAEKLVKELGPDLVRHLGKDLTGEAMKALVEKLGKDLVEKLVAKGLTGKAIEELAEKAGKEALEHLVKDLSKEGIEAVVKGLSKESLDKLVKEGLSGSSIKQLMEDLPNALEPLLKDLTGAEVKTLVETAGKEVVDVLGKELTGAATKELVEGVAKETLQALVKEVDAKTIKELFDQLQKDALERLTKEWGAAGLKEVTDAINAKSLKEFVDEIGLGELVDFGSKALKEIGPHLKPDELAELLTAPGIAGNFVRKVCEQAGAGPALKAAAGHFGSFEALGKVFAKASDHAVPEAAFNAFLKDAPTQGWKSLDEIDTFFKWASSSSATWTKILQWSRTFSENCTGAGTKVKGRTVAGAGGLGSKMVDGVKWTFEQHDVLHILSRHSWEHFPPSSTWAKAHNGFWHVGVSQADLVTVARDVMAHADFAKLVRNGDMMGVVAGKWGVQLDHGAKGLVSIYDVTADLIDKDAMKAIVWIFKSK